MSKICTRVALLLSIASLLGAQTAAIAIVHARIIDGRGGPAIPDGTMLLRGKRIESVGAASTVSVPSDARMIDARGKTVMPGLADMHLHLVGGWDGETVDMLGYQRYLNALLYAGVTTVLDTGNVQPYILQIRQEVASGRLLGPRIYLCRIPDRRAGSGVAGYRILDIFSQPDASNGAASEVRWGGHYRGLDSPRRERTLGSACSSTRAGVMDRSI
jgi:hypothetical protein